jgi:hypothetical protein
MGERAHAHDVNARAGKLRDALRCDAARYLHERASADPGYGARELVYLGEGR